MALLGSPRPTIDIDFIGDDLHPDEVQKAIVLAAKELKIYVEPVPFGQFIPLPTGSAERNIRIAQYGNLEVYIADPYSIALSKLDRGLDTDLDDIVFLIRHHHVVFEELENIFQRTLQQAGKFDLHPEIVAHFSELKKRLKQ